MSLIDNNKTATRSFIKTILSNKYTDYNVTEDLINRIVDIHNKTNFKMELLDGSDFNNTESEDGSCGGSLKKWVTIYANVYHPYCAIIVCLLGIVTNCLNIIVLTRKDMATAPINRILTALAWADMLLMMEYIPFVYYYNLESQWKMEFPYYGAVYTLLHIHFTQIVHTTSICLTLTLAIWRYLAIGYMEKNHILCSHKRCTAAIIICYILPILLCSPAYPTLKIKSTKIFEDKEYILYNVDLSDMVANDNTLLRINFWLFAIFLKLLPCLILMIISIWLIRTLFKAKRGRQVLKSNDSNLLITNSRECKKISKYERRADRTTKMLVAILLLFLLTELPQGLFALVIGLKGKTLFLTCYQHYGEVMDILALLNGSINFVLYCCMNRMFRITFGQLFRNKILSKWVAPAISDTPTVIVGGHRTITTTV